MAENCYITLKDIKAAVCKDNEIATNTSVINTLIGVAGQLVRKRNLSKSLIFGDVLLQDNELLELVIRVASDSPLSASDVRDINYSVHLGDIVLVSGIIKCEGPDSSGPLLLYVSSIAVQSSWTDIHQNERFDPTLYTHKHIKRVVKPTIEPTNVVRLNGTDIACKFYFSSNKGVNCLRGGTCNFWHGEIVDFEKNRKLWYEMRLAQRRQYGQLSGDIHRPDEKQVKTHRGRLFCEWLIATFTKELLLDGAKTGVMDIGGGKGDISVHLWHHNGIPTTLIDPRERKISKKLKKLIARSQREPCKHFQCYLNDQMTDEVRQHVQNASILVGMHPDEATESIVDLALEYHLPFAVVPCCVMSQQFPNRILQTTGEKVETYDTFITYLKTKDSSIRSAYLPFTGRNLVLYRLLQ